MLDMKAQQRSKRNRSQPTTAAAATPTETIGGVGGRASSSPSALSLSRGNHLITRENSLSEEGESYYNHSSHSMSNVGAMVIQQKPQSAMSDNSQRRFL